MAPCALRTISVQAILLILNVFIGNGVSKICPVRPYTKNTEEHGSVYQIQTQEPDFDCPRPSDPQTYSECCSSNVGQKCCPPEQRHFYEIDNKIATAIAVSVTLTCVAITVAIIICCFWSKCPLYSTCGVHYSPQDEIVYGKEDESLDMKVMPADAEKSKSFSCRKPSLPKGSAV